ncbi:unnamed protein product [Blepharisma stoltei]|uniref:Uncharacterized protein n=1 Tax=Blepharisma stoltei TaxID=1481888 RepID=A0AAU9JTM5_9CILI|nr:unnamed protein product [Blepharisma stoltei]
MIRFSSEDAKRLIFEAPDTTRRTLFVLLFTFVCLIIHIYCTYLGTANSWTCELDSTDPKHNYVCKELMQKASCSTLTGPLKAEILLNINDEVKASALIVCPWENAISELRICFALGSALVVIIGLLSLSNEDKKLADLHINSAYFFTLLLVISSTFDLFAVSNSNTNNYSLCNLTNEFSVEDGISGEYLSCTHDIYNFTAYLGYVAAVMLLASSYYLKGWRDNLSLDGL